MRHGIPLAQVTDAFEKLVRMALELDESTPVRATLARVTNGVRLVALVIGGAPASAEAWTLLRATELVNESPMGPAS
jgi:hypothetical protein